MRIIFLLLFPIISISSFSQDIQVNYIANDGFLIQVNNKRVLVDALFGNKDFSFAERPDEKLLNEIINGKADFAQIDLACASHSHIDHFYAPFVSEFLNNHPETKWISTAQANEELEDLLSKESLSNVETIVPAQGVRVDTSINGIDLSVFRIMHGPYYTEDPESEGRVNKHAKVENVGFLFNIDEIKIFHGGDANYLSRFDIEDYQLKDEEIDLVMLGRGFLTGFDETAANNIVNLFNPKHIVFMHVIDANNAQYQKGIEMLRAHFPNIHLFSESRESHQF